MNSTAQTVPLINFSASISSESILPPPLPENIIISLIVGYSLIILLSVVFNLTVIIVIAGNGGKRPVTDLFILSLAVSDLMVSTINMPFQLYYYVVNVWNIGLVLCKLSKYLQAVTIVSTVLTLTAIAIDRFVAICNPLGARRFHSKGSAIVGLVIVWLISLVSVSPQLMVQRLDMRIIIDMMRNEPIGIAFICAEFFPRGEQDGFIYSIVIFLVLYTVPVLVMFLCYGAIAHRLWIRQPVGDALSNPPSFGRQILQRKGIIKMLITIVLAFTVLWFPFFAISLYDDLQVEQNDVSFKTVMAILQLIGYSNCCVNPIIYTFLNSKFQKDFSALFCTRSRGMISCCTRQNITIKQTIIPAGGSNRLTINSITS